MVRIELNSLYMYMYTLYIMYYTAVSVSDIWFLLKNNENSMMA